VIFLGFASPKVDFGEKSGRWGDLGIEWRSIGDRLQDYQNGGRYGLVAPTPAIRGDQDDCQMDDLKEDLDTRGIKPGDFVLRKAHSRKAERDGFQ